MKHTFLLLLLALVAIASGCSNNNIPAPTPSLTPSGTFSGLFTLYHLHSTGKVDSTSAMLQLSMQTATGYKITGDTATLHAGSYGAYYVNTTSGSVEFVDQTVPPTGMPKKIHLSGLYNYRYDGTHLQIAAYGPADTLTYFYNMKKIGN